MRPVRKAPRPARPPRSSMVRLASLVVLCLSFAVAAVRADSYDERRVRAGARLFRSMLAADTMLEQRRDAAGVLHVMVYGTDGAEVATSEVAGLIAPSDPAKAAVRGMPLKVEASGTLPANASGPKLAGIFLASNPSSAELDRLIRWSIEQKVIVYSPFEGHVERGVAGGLAIEAKVQPHVNLKTLKASGIELKPFFLKVAKVQQ